MENSLEYRGAVLWNRVKDYEDCGRLSLKSLLEYISSKDYFKDFNFKAVFARHKQCDFLYY